MPTRWPDRLAIRGSNITLPDGKPAHLRGFNLLFQLDTMYAYPRVDTDGLLKRLLPGANIVRLVMLHWDDRPTEDAGPNNENDCSEVQRGNDGHTIRVRCLEQFDDVLRWTAGRACGRSSRHGLPSPPESQMITASLATRCSLTVRSAPDSQRRGPQ